MRSRVRPEPCRRSLYVSSRWATRRWSMCVIGERTRGGADGRGILPHASARRSASLSIPPTPASSIATGSTVVHRAYQPGEETRCMTADLKSQSAVAALLLTGTGLAAGARSPARVRAWHRPARAERRARSSSAPSPTAASRRSRRRSFRSPRPKRASRSSSSRTNMA